MSKLEEMTIGGFTIREKAAFPPNSNPYHYDAFNMGKGVGNNIELMFRAYEKDHADYLIIVDKVSGKRLVITGFALAIENEQVTPAEGA